MSRTSEIISVVAGGWSFQYVNHAKVPGYVIACNDAALLLKRDVQIAISMDRLWCEYRWKELEMKRLVLFARNGALKNIVGHKDKVWVHPFKNNDLPIELVGDRAFSDDPAVIHGNNTGVCALNLAWIMKPKQLFMFGFDMCRAPTGNPYWYPPYPWTAKTGGTKPARYVQWSKEFTAIAAHFKEIGTEVLNVSDASLIKSFKRVSPKQMGMAI